MRKLFEIGGLVAAAILWLSPVRRLVSLPDRPDGEATRPVDAVAVAVAAEMDQPPGA